MMNIPTIITLLLLLVVIYFSFRHARKSKGCDYCQACHSKNSCCCENKKDLN